MKRVTVPVLALMVAAFAVGCDDDDDPINPGQQNAIVRFVNATSDLASLDVVANGTVAAAAVAGRGTSACVPLSASVASIAIRQAGGTTDAGTFTFSPALAGEARYTVIALGTAAGLQFVQTNDEFTAPGASRARIRVINATTSANPFDVFITAPNDPMTTPSASGLAAKASTTFLDIPSGATEVRVANAGSTDVMIDTNTLDLQAGDVRTIVLVDDPTSTTDFGFVVVQPCT